MGMKITGLARAISKFDALIDDIPDEAQEAAEDYADLVYRQSQVLVPKDTNALAASGRTYVSDGTGSSRAVTIQYGNSNAEGVGVYYAAAVHETFIAGDIHGDAPHTHYHAPPTQSKYLEQPLSANISRYENILERHMRSAVTEAF